MLTLNLLPWRQQYWQWRRRRWYRQMLIITAITVLLVVLLYGLLAWRLQQLQQQGVWSHQRWQQQLQAHQQRQQLQHQNQQQRKRWQMWRRDLWAVRRPALLVRNVAVMLPETIVLKQIDYGHKQVTLQGTAPTAEVLQQWLTELQQQTGMTQWQVTTLHSEQTTNIRFTLTAQVSVQMMATIAKARS